MKTQELVKNQRTLFLTSKDITDKAKQIGLDNLMKKIIIEVEKGFRNFQEGKIKVPKRTGLYFNNGLVEVMPVFDRKLICYKIGSVYKNNCTFNLPSTLAHLILVDRNTGYPLAFIEDTFITALRTGAASGVATKYLANPDSNNVGIIGTGVQAYTQLHAVASVLPNLKRVFVYDKYKNKSEKFISEYKKLNIKGSGLDYIVCSTPIKVCQNSDVIITATTKSNDEEPVIRYSWIKEGTHINAIGTDAPKKGGYTELDLELLKKSKVVVDYFKQAIKEGEAQNLKKKEIYAELGEIISGKKKGRVTKKEITIFDSTGVAFQDLVSVKLFLKNFKKSVSFSQQSNTNNLYVL